MLRYKVIRNVDGKPAEEIAGEPDNLRLVEIVNTHPAQSFDVLVRDWNPETKQAGEWQHFYSINEDTIRCGY